MTAPCSTDRNKSLKRLEKHNLETKGNNTFLNTSKTNEKKNLLHLH